MVVVLGVDAHKRTHTVVAVDANGRKLGEKTIATTSAGHDDAVRWARGRYGRELLWGVEDCRPLTARLEGDLLAAGSAGLRGPPHLMSRARASSRTPGKSDPIDALAVARAVLREPDLPVASHDPVSLELSLLVGRREDLVGQRTATINRLLSRVHQLDPSRGPVGNWQRHKTRSPPHGSIAGDLRGCKPQGCTADVGRASAAMTLDVYAELFESDMDAVAEKVGKMWARRADSQGCSPSRTPLPAN